MSEDDLIKIKWTSCDEQLPKKGVSLWLHDGKEMVEGYLMGDDDREFYKESHSKEYGEQTWENANWHFPIENRFTHWMYKFDFPRPIQK